MWLWKIMVLKSNHDRRYDNQVANGKLARKITRDGLFEERNNIIEKYCTLQKYRT